MAEPHYPIATLSPQRRRWLCVSCLTDPATPLTPAQLGHLLGALRVSPAWYPTVEEDGALLAMVQSWLDGLLQHDGKVSAFVRQVLQDDTIDFDVEKEESHGNAG
jgi:hypothetical protein